MRNLVIVIGLALLSGCAIQPVFKPLPAIATSKMKNTDVVVGIAQKEMLADIPASNTAGAMGGGLLFALIDTAVNASRANTAEAAIVPVRDALLDFQVEKSWQDAVNRLVVPIPWIADDSVDISRTVTVPDFEKRIDGSSKSGVIFLVVDYRLSADFKTFKINAQANLFPKADDLRKLQFDLYKDTSKINEAGGKTLFVNSIYRNTVDYSRSLDAGTKDLSSAATAWASNGGKNIRAALSEGIEAVVALVAYDLQKQTTQVSQETRPVVKEETFDIVVAGKTLTAKRSSVGLLSVTGKN